VLDVSATSFAQHFYLSLARGLSVGEAARESLIAVNYSIAGESIDWAVPVVYARDPEAALCRRGLDAEAGPPVAAGAGTPGGAGAGPPVAARAAQRRGVRAPLRIGVWDVQHAFPQLESTLRQMNQAQDVYGFEVIALTAPIGTWRLQETDAKDRAAVLQPDEVARRLAPQVQQLGLDALACMTSYRMEGNFYG